MLAFVRVFIFYIAMAALLTWAIFALGWNEALELPGFEGTRVPTAEIPPVAERTVEVAKAKTIKIDTATVPLPSPSSSLPLPSVETAPITPPVPPIARQIEPPATAPPPRVTVETSDTTSQIPPIKRVQPPSPPPAAPPAVVVEPAKPAPVLISPPPPAVVADPPPPQRAAQPPIPPPIPPPAVKPAPPAATPPPPVVATPAPQPPKAAAAPATAPPASASATRRARRWAPERRVAGFTVQDLVAQLRDNGRAPDDMPCVVLDNLVFVAGTSRPQPRFAQELPQIARALIGNTSHQVEIGSRLGPGRPMKSDIALRADRVRVVRDALIRYGVSASRLTADPDDRFERAADEVRARNGRRMQAMGLCVYG